MASCEGCGRRVIWMENTSTGRKAPVDPDPVPDGNVVMHGHGYRVLTRAEARRLDAGPTLLEMGEPIPNRYRLHFVSCPKADHFRRCKRCHTEPCRCPA